MPVTNAPPSAVTHQDGIIDAVLLASRALVAVAARSLAGLEDVTLPQYRALVVLAQGPERPVDLAVLLRVNPSTAGRMSSRLAAKGLVRRRRDPHDRRTVRVSLTAAGRDLVDEVTRRRRAEIAKIVTELPAAHRDDVVAALRAFADAAGEKPERDWYLGWD